MNAIETRGLVRTFGSRRAVDGIDMEVREGELVALLGVNGAGKTTTIKMLTSLLPPTEGEAFILGKNVVTESKEAKALHNVSPQETAVAGALSVEENLIFMAEIYGASKTEARERAGEMLKKFSLTERRGDKAKTLSGGLMRRLSIAMALITKPRVLFLDEPTLGLDVRARRELWAVIRGLKGKMTTVLTTHYLEEAEALADRIFIMHEGKLKCAGTADEIKAAAGASNIEDAFLILTDAKTFGEGGEF